MTTSVKIAELFAPERDVAPIFGGGREVVEYAELTSSELEAIERCVRFGYELLRKISPDLAEDFLRHLPIFQKFGGIAKALFPGDKPIAFPSEPGKIGVNFIVPQLVKYVATPSPSAPAYTSYSNNSWEISVTAGTPAYILGDGTNYYKASPIDNQRALLVIMKDGLVEVGTTPSTDQFKLWTEVQSRYGVYTIHPLVDQPIELGKTIYRYTTPGVIPVYHDLGIMWGFIPKRSGTVDMRLIGIAFFEHDLLANFKWVS